MGTVDLQLLHRTCSSFLVGQTPGSIAQHWPVSDYACPKQAVWCRRRSLWQVLLRSLCLISCIVRVLLWTGGGVLLSAKHPSTCASKPSEGKVSCDKCLLFGSQARLLGASLAGAILSPCPFCVVSGSLSLSQPAMLVKRFHVQKAV